MVDVILTSYARYDLLEQALDSFYEYNDYPISNFFIHEDYGLENMNEDQKMAMQQLQEKYPDIQWMCPEQRQGQINALDALWRNVSTPYCLQMEDDWLVYRKGFISDSIEVLEQKPKIVMCYLREHNDVNGHPIEITGNGLYDLMSRNYKGLWHGYSFNFSVKRLEDYKAIGSFAKHTRFIPRRPWESEIAIGRLYYRMGYSAAILRQGYVRHIGDNRGIRS